MTSNEISKELIDYIVEGIREGLLNLPYNRTLIGTITKVPAENDGKYEVRLVNTSLQI